MKFRCALIAAFALMAAPPAAAQDADALAIPVRKNGADTQPQSSEQSAGEQSTAESAAAAASAERATARRLTSRLRDSGPAPTADQNSAAKPSENPAASRTSPRASSSPVLESRASLYNMESAEIPTGLLRKRTSGSSPAPSTNTDNQPAAPARETASEPTQAAPIRTGNSTEPRRTASRERDSGESRNRESSRRTAQSDEASNKSSDRAPRDERSSRENRTARNDAASNESERSESTRDVVAEADSSENPESNDMRQQANMAALDNLHPSGGAPDDRAFGNENAATAQTSALPPAPTPPAGFGQEQVIASNQLPPGQTEPFEPTANSVQTAVAAPQPAPNLYLPQATPAPRRGSIWSRLFGRNNRQASAAPQPVIDFNSDYATRDSGDVCPVVLPGYGINGRDIPYGQEDQYRLTSSLPDHYRPTDLVLLPTQYCHYGNALYLRREAAASLCQMIGAAAQQGLTIRVVSAFRDFDHQMRLYTQAVARGGEDQKSVARPGRSEHYLGTTVDLTNDEEHALKRSFGDTPEGRWLAANAANYGFKLTVMSSNARRSHNDEPWHLRYLGSALNNPPSTISPIAQQQSQPQRRDVFGAIGRFLGLRR